MLTNLDFRYCNFILNVAPNRDGLIDDNALNALKEMGKLYHPHGALPKFPIADAPIISSNLAKRHPASASWSNDMNIMDFAVDDDFGSNWSSHPGVKNPWFEVDLIKETGFNMVVITEEKANATDYTLEYFANNTWHHLADGKNGSKIKIHRFPRIWGQKVRIKFNKFNSDPAIAELGVYNERG